MSYAMMPLSDYKAACDKVREKVDLTIVKFEDTDFRYIRSVPFTIEGGKTYTLNLKLSDSSLFYEWIIIYSSWAADDSPWIAEYEYKEKYTFSNSYDMEARLFINIRNGLTINDIISASIECDGEIVANFVEPKKIKSGELADTIDLVYSTGKETEYNHFWDVYQQNGSLTVYDCAFAGRGWTDETFNPKYKAMPTSAYMMFRYAEITKDISETVDFSNCKNFGYTFYAAKLKTVNVNATQSTSLLSAFASASIETLHLIVSSAGATTNDTFTNMRLLKKFTIEGVISGGNINISASTLLTVDSAKNLINALADNMGTDNEFKYKVTFSEATKSLLEAEGATAPNGDTWLNYMTAKGWNR